MELKYKFTRRRGAADTDRTGVEPGLPTGQLQLLNIWISSSLIWEQQSVKEYSCSRVLVHLVLWSQMLHSQTRARLPYSSSAQPEPHLQLHSQLVKADQELNQGAYTIHRVVHILCATFVCLCKDLSSRTGALYVTIQHHRSSLRNHTTS